MIWLGVGLFCCVLSIAAGAFGAHGLKDHLDSSALALWETAARYLMYGGLGLALLGLFSQQLARSPGPAAWMLLAGTVVFSGTVGALALGGPRWLGAVTPVGGGLMILGFLAFALAALSSARA